MVSGEEDLSLNGELQNKIFSMNKAGHLAQLKKKLHGVIIKF